MILLPAIDLHEGKCVRLFRGDYDTAEVVAQDPLSTAKRFQEQGARWLHMVDLDGAKDGKPQNQQLIFDVVENTDLHVEVGGGIRDMDTVEYYLDRGVSRVILGSAALRDPEFVRQAVKRHGKQIAVGIDALDGKVAAEGWLEQSQVDYVDFAKEMESLGVQYLICTDIHQDGTMNGPNLVMLDKLNRAVHCHIIASGGVSSLLDIVSLYDLGLYGAIAGKSLYTGALDLRTAIIACHKISGKNAAGDMPADAGLYEPGVLPQVFGDGLHLVLQPQPQDLVEQGGDLRPHPENRQRLFRLRRRHLAHPGKAEGPGLPHRQPQLLLQAPAGRGITERGVNHGYFARAV